MTSVLTQMVARALLVPTLVVAAAILVKGYADVGDGFAAGIVATLAVLLQYLAFGHAAVDRALPVRHAPAVAAAGLLFAVVVMAIPLLRGDAPLTHTPGPGEKVAHIGSLELITAVAFDVGVFLLVLGAAVTILDALARAGEEEDV
jgi:multisubunit Na+/H+ antiporter MnhB subunit